jgi:hypothetical protein
MSGPGNLGFVRVATPANSCENRSKAAHFYSLFVRLDLFAISIIINTLVGFFALISFRKMRRFFAPSHPRSSAFESAAIVLSLVHSRCVFIFKHPSNAATRPKSTSYRLSTLCGPS